MYPPRNKETAAIIRVNAFFDHIREGEIEISFDIDGTVEYQDEVPKVSTFL